jgi:hypothetical protein
VSLAEGIDATTPAGRLQMHILGAIAEFERARIAERVRLGLARVHAQGTRLGRPKLEVTGEHGVQGRRERLRVSAGACVRLPIFLGRWHSKWQALPRIGAPVQLATFPSTLVTMDLAPDGQRFLALVPERAGLDTVTIVQFWREALAPSGKVPGGPPGLGVVGRAGIIARLADVPPDRHAPWRL